ncbi:MAG: bacteriocin family protein [Candidatus Aminicenantes bacterium]|nr:bacteriocin family protein [Candidatus Aminicenantes bacterium]
MSNLLKRNLAPLGQKAWDEIDEQAKSTLKGNLSARKLVDFDGPFGWTRAAVNLGRVNLDHADEPVQGIRWGLRQVQPLLEARVDFTLSMEELEHLERGVRNPDLAPLETACRQASHFEETAVYHGIEAAGINGIIPSSPHPAVEFNELPEGFMQGVEAAILTLQQEGIGGPYHMVLGTRPYQLLQQGDQRGYPLNQRVAGLLGGTIAWSPAIEGGLVLSGRGGDFQLTVGQDLSVGYKSDQREMVHLFITESFTFQVLDPAAAVVLKA